MTTHNRRISFAADLRISRATKSDWTYFARWHYRSHHIGFTKFVTQLWHGEEPIGICLFVSPPISLRLRNKFFGRSGKWERTALKAMNRQLIQLSRVVLHPTYRGAGIAADFVRQSCEMSGYPWIETLTQMGHINPFFEKAGFIRVGVTQPHGSSRVNHSLLYGGRRRSRRGLVTQETCRKSHNSRPVYYVFDNRRRKRMANEEWEDDVS